MSSVFHALGDATRRHMLRDLAGGERTVSQLAQPFAISLAAASKHIKALEHAWLIRREVRGRTHLCRLDMLEQLLRAEDASKSKKPKSRKTAPKSKSGKGDE